jgi:hypothetical protein
MGKLTLACATGYKSHTITFNSAMAVQFGNTFAVVVSPDDGRNVLLNGRHSTGRITTEKRTSHPPRGGSMLSRPQKTSRESFDGTPSRPTVSAALGGF